MLEKIPIYFLVYNFLNLFDQIDISVFLNVNNFNVLYIAVPNSSHLYTVIVIFLLTYDTKRSVNKAFAVSLASSPARESNILLALYFILL